MDRTGVLVGAVPLGAEQAFLEEIFDQMTDRNASHKENIYSVAVDGGISFFLEKGIMPDYWVGDMDSVSGEDLKRGSKEMDLKENFCQVPVMKDDTDMALAVEKAYREGCEEILIFGGIGGNRLSHTLANIQLMQRYAKKGCHIRMIRDQVQMEVLYCGAKRFSKEMQGLISVFSLTDRAENVEIKGLQYEHEGVLTNECALGISNAFIGKESLISVGSGALLLLYEKV